MVWVCDVDRGNGSCENGYENDVKESRGKGRSKKRQSDTIENNSGAAGVFLGYVEDHDKRWFRTRVVDSKTVWKKLKEKKKNVEKICLFFFYSHGDILSVAVHQQHTDGSAEDGQHSQVRSGEVRGGGHSDAVPSQNPHTACGQGADVEADRRAAGRGRAVPARAHTGRPVAAAALEEMEGVLRVRFEQESDDAGDDGSGQRFGKTGKRHVRHAGRVHQGAGKQPGERPQQPAGVGKMHGAIGVPVGRKGRQIRVQATSVLVRPLLFFLFFFFIVD